LHLKFEYPPIMKVVFPETTKNFYISRFWSFIMKFWECARKTIKERVWPGTRVWLCQFALNMIW
jgi:hypothetical protein